MSRISPIVVLPIVAVAIVVGALSLRGGGDDGYVVYAKFKDAGGILKNYNVKIGQVKAGTVEQITLDRADNAVVKMALDPEAAPIGPGAVANVRPVNLLGERYVELSPGDLERPLPSGSTIPTSRTSAPIELDDLLNVLDPDTRGAMRIIINEAGLALAGRGTDFNSVLEDLPPSLDSAQKLVSEVARENAALDRLAVAGDRVLASIATRDDDLTRLVNSAAGALGTVAQRRERLGATVSSAPAALAGLRRTLTNLRAAAGRLTPAAADLRAAEPALARSLGRLPQFARDAHGTLRTATEVAPTLRRLGRQSVPTLRELRPTAARLAAFSADLRPLLKAADDNNGFGWDKFLEFIAGWASTTSQKDGIGHVFRTRATVDRQLIESALKRYTANMAPATRRERGPAAKRHAGPAPAARRPADDLERGLPAVRLPRVKQLVDKVVAAPVTDQSRRAVDTLLDYLLGP